MSLNKQQLEAVNQANFPDNNSQFITPQLLREFNTDMIDAIQLTGSYATTGSNTFVGNQTINGNLNVSGVISASVLHVQVETASVIYSSGSNQLGDELTDIQTLSGSVKIQGQLLINGVPLSSGSATIDTGSLVTTASFNQYTQSTNLRLNSLESNSASVNVSISNLNTTTASLNTSITNLNAFSASQKTLNGTFATTGSNTFTGNQIIDRASKLYTNGIYWTDVTAGFNNLEIINQGGGNLDFASLNGGRMRVVNTPLVLTGSILSSNSDISTSANIYAANLTGSGGTINTGSFATTGSNTFTGENYFSQSVQILGSLSMPFGNITMGYPKNMGDSYNYNAIVSTPGVNAISGGGRRLVLQGDVMGSTANRGVTILNGLGITGSVVISPLPGMTPTGGDLDVAGTFTSSLQQGYVWVGDSTGRTVTVATSSFFVSGSGPTDITSLNAFTASQLLINTGYNTFTQSQQTYNTNNDTKWNTLGGQSGSWITESETGSFARYDVSNPWSANQTFTNISAVSASFQYVQTIFETASVIYSSGSNQFGDALNDTQTLYGNVLIIGSGSINSNRILTTADTASLSVENALTSSITRNVVVIARNGGASTLPAGTVVHITSAVGDNPVFTTASYDNEALSSNTFGLLRYSSPSGADVEVVVSGIVTGVNTNPALGYAAGDILYLSSSGQFTKVQPQAPNQIVTLGQVLRAQQNNGSIYVSINNGWEIDELHNVQINNAQTGDLLQYESSSYGLWKNKSISGAGITTTSSFNAYTSSTNNRLNNIESTTASLNSSITQLNVSSASQQVSINNLNTTTASLLIETQNLELFTASATTQLNNLASSQSIDNTKWNTLGSQSGSWVTETESGSFLITASFDNGTRNLTFTKGNNTTFAVNIPDVSGSGTINTGSFATTGSNAFFGTNTFSGAVSFTGSAPSILSSSFSGSLITNLTDIYTDIPAVRQIVTLTSASYAALLSGSLTNPNTLYIVSGSISGSGGGGTTDITALNAFTASQLIINSGYNTYTSSNDAKVNSLISATGSYATTGSNTFVGNQIISGTFIQSGSNSLPGGPGGQTAGTHILNRVLISGPSGGDTPRLWISGSDGAVTELGRSFINIDSTKTGLGASTFLAGNVANSAVNTVAVYNDDFSVDSEIQMFANSSSVGFADWDNGTAFNYVPFMTLTPNVGDNPIPQFKRSISVTGSVDITGQFTINGVPISGSSGTLPAGLLSSSVTNFVDYSASVDSRINGIVVGSGFATTGSNTFVGLQTITGTPDANLDMYSNAGNFDTFNVLTSASNGVYLSDYDQSSLNAWLYIPTNSGNNPAPQMRRGLGITGSLSVSGSTTLRGNTTFIDRSGGNNNNIYLGSSALSSNTTGIGNVAIGQGALSNNTTGNNNFALGTNALQSNVGGNTNFAAGADSGRFSSGSSNIFIGGGAGQSITGSGNVIIGAFTSTAGTVVNNNIVLADGFGNVRAQYDSSDWSFKNSVIITGSLSATNAVRYVGGNDNLANTQLLNNTSLITKNVSISSGNQSGSFQQLSMSTGSGGNTSFQMQAILSGSTADLSIFNSAGSTSARMLADDILIAKVQGFPNTPATNFKVESTNLSLMGDVKVNKGSNKTSDIVTVGSGGLTVSSSLVTSNSIILATTQDSNVAGGTYPAVVGNKTNGSFSLSHNYGGNLQVAYLIINPA
jgi:uncharacterized coiled-coil protein SlyX